MRIKKALAGITAAAFITGSAIIAAPAAQATTTGGTNTVYDKAVAASKGYLPFDRNGGDFDILVAAVKATGLKGALDDPKADLTVFAPTDATFKATFGGRTEAETLFRTLKAVNYDIKTLKGVLLYHVASVPSVNTDGKKGLSFADVASVLKTSNPATVPMLNGKTTSVSLKDGVAKINSSTIVATDIFGSNGVIHVIGDKVLLP